MSNQVQLNDYQRMLAAILGKKMRAVDWRNHVTKNQTPEEARTAYYELLCKTLADYDVNHIWQTGSDGSRCPSVETIFVQPFWWNDPKNLSCFPTEMLHPDFLPMEISKRTFPPPVPTVACSQCGKCSVASTTFLEANGGHQYAACYQIALEAIWFTFHPKSPHSGISAQEAELLIKQALRDDWSPFELAATVEGAHVMDDFDAGRPHNRKVGDYGSFPNMEERFQELVLGDIKFLSAMMFNVKKFREGKHLKSRKCRDLHASRDAVTRAYKETIDIQHLIEFTKLLWDETTGGRNFSFKGFLRVVLPFWTCLAALDPQQSDSL